jgi:6-phosphogluconolactonase
LNTASRFELAHFANADTLVRSAAAEWLQDVERVVSGGAPYLVALSGGRIARLFFSAVAEAVGSGQASLTSVHFFWGDERCVTPDDPESNFGLARGLLFAPLHIPEVQIHRVRGEDPVEVAAAEAEAELRRVAPLAANGQPVLDMAFLGMGEDGHVASLFPEESEQAMTSNAVFRPVVAAKSPPRRITLGYPALAAARQVWVLASGPGKEHALRESLAREGKTPLARVLGLRQRTRILTDIEGLDD